MNSPAQKLASLTLSLIVLFGHAEVFASEQEQEKLPKAHYKFMQGKHLYDNPELAAYVSRIGKKVAENSDKPNTNFRFFVIDDAGVNALTPGYGLVYVYRGLLGLMTSEAQLAGVLAHEIGHNIGRHVQRTKSKHTVGSLAGIFAAILAGNSGVKNAMDMGNAERLTAFQRELELEADEYGAEYLYRSKYDPEEMLIMLGQLKDYQTFMSRVSGSARGSYHGVFASHPRVDKRLQEVILKAGTLPPGENFRGRGEFRKIMTGVAFGENYTGNKREDQERFTQKNLGITFLYPSDWTQLTKGKSIILKDAEKTVQLKILVEKTVDKSLSSQQVLEAKYPDDLSGIDKVNDHESKDLGTLGRRPQQRVAVIQVGRNTYHFLGIARNNQLSEEQDQIFVDIIRSFRRATRKDLLPDEVKRIYFKRLEPGETYASLAAQSKAFGIHTEAYLRLMNAQYPKGQPEPGTYIKLVK